jgi:ABC-type transporter Mla MlaB component
LASSLPLSDAVQTDGTVLRISSHIDPDQNTRLTVEGWLTGLSVEELRRECEQALSESHTLTLDLEKLWFVDAQGVALLRELASRNVAHVNCSMFVRHQLKETMYDAK